MFFLSVMLLLPLADLQQRIFSSDVCSPELALLSARRTAPKANTAIQQSNREHRPGQGEHRHFSNQTSAERDVLSRLLGGVCLTVRVTQRHSVSCFADSCKGEVPEEQQLMKLLLLPRRM